jgi:hypothetical protein
MRTRKFKVKHTSSETYAYIDENGRMHPLKVRAVPLRRCNPSAPGIAGFLDQQFIGKPKKTQ